MPAPLPPDPELPLLHTRTYDVRSYRKADDLVLLRGRVQDEKPPGLYLADDPEPLTVHHMVVDLVVRYPQLEITEATVTFGTHPHGTCPSIAGRYGELVGLSIARGFGAEVRARFGGPRGCTHVNAMLQAMAPVAIQTVWSMQPPGASGPADERTGPRTKEEVLAGMRHNLDTCHVWDREGRQVSDIVEGRPMEPPLWMTERLVALGKAPEEWRPRFSR